MQSCQVKQEIDFFKYTNCTSSCNIIKEEYDIPDDEPTFKKENLHSQKNIIISNNNCTNKYNIIKEEYDIPDDKLTIKKENFNSPKNVAIWNTNCANNYNIKKEEYDIPDEEQIIKNECSSSTNNIRILHTNCTDICNIIKDEDDIPDGGLNIKKEYLSPNKNVAILNTNSTNSYNIIKEEYDISDDEHLTALISNTNPGNQKNDSLVNESKQIQWPSKKNKQVNSESIKTSQLNNVNSITNHDLIPKASKLINSDKFTDVITIANDENQKNDKQYSPTGCSTGTTYKCSICNYSTINKRNFNKHVRIHKNSKGKGAKSIRCNLCREKFSYYWEFVRHSKLCELLVPEKAALGLTERQRLSREADSVASIGEDVLRRVVKFYCSKCEKNFDFMTKDTKKCPDCKKKIKLYCGSCSKCYATLRRLIFHLRTNNVCNKGNEGINYRISASKELSCAHCDFKDKEKDKLIKHLFSYHGDENGLICRNLEKEVLNEENNSKRKSCSFSRASISKKAKLENSVSQDSKFTTTINDTKEILKFVNALCPKCSKSEILHNKERYVCMNSKCKSALHYECTICNKQYTSLTGVTYHLESVCHPRMNFQCNECGYISHVEVTVKQHVKYHHPPADQKDTFPCDKCGTKCKTEKALKAHSYYCKPEPIKCELCSYTTKSKGNLNRHLKAIHSRKK